MPVADLMYAVMVQMFQIAVVHAFCICIHCKTAHTSVTKNHIKRSN